VATMPEPGAPAPDLEDPDDDRLRLIFTCCHPALPMNARVPLALRGILGLSVAEIARAFLLPEATVAQRLTRAKAKIRAAAIPFRVPPPHRLRERLAAVLAVIYLLFNQGYDAGSERIGDDAVRLARTLVTLMPRRPEAEGLLALMLLQRARSATRVDADGRFVPLEEQDRSAWDREAIGRAESMLERALRRGDPGPYQVQAAIAACHATAASVADTDWAQILGLYDELNRLAPSPIVELNRAVAVGMASGPAAGLDLIDRLDGSGRLDGYAPLAASRADLLRRLGRGAEAVDAYRRAAALTDSEAQRRYLEDRAAELTRRR
ncbi:MAG TPA: DUF6596 domain-containing protein, partial [Stackebrandtia sp.]|uniref:RNA polymerase sigma factor n=1 Tax=Stackebrandtia sp. TaxID=2023065 RepID=UPI002D52E3E9